MGPWLPGVVGDVVFGAEVENIVLVLVVVSVGVKGVHANPVHGRQIVDFDAFAGERVGAEVDRSLFAVGILFGQLGEGGDPGAETGLAVAADEVVLEAIFYFTSVARVWLHGRRCDWGPKL